MLTVKSRKTSHTASVPYIRAVAAVALPLRPVGENVTCEPPPEIAGGKVQGVKKSRYLPGERAQYQCWQGFQMTGDSTVACQNGTWTKLPKCRGCERGG
uniref:Sushi domain-containing protein n=1 Tax=Apteryx owenii TaxID=8824 RepID=A0A8B9Q330_APTOW